jgi:hypothetical protein
MAIAFRSIASTTYASRTNTTVTAPASIANDDILIAAIFAGANAGAPAITPPTGFTELLRSPTQATDMTFFGQFHVYWKRAASESGSYVFTHATGSTQAGIVAISGVPSTGTPIFTYSVNSLVNAIGATTTATGITTGAANDLLLYIAHDWAGGGALSPPTGFTERLDGLIYIADKIQASAGASGNVTQTNGNSTVIGNWAAFLLDISTSTVTDPTVTDVFTPSTALGSDDLNSDSAFRVVSTLTAASGGSLRASFTAASTGASRVLIIKEASFGKWDSTAGDGSTTATPIRLTFSGSNSVIIAKGQTVFSDIVAHPGFSLASGDKVVICYGTDAFDAAQRYSSGNSNAFTWFKGSVGGTFLNFQAAFGTGQGASRVGGGSAFYDYALAKVTTFTTAGGAVSVNATGNSCTASTSTPTVNYAFKVNATTNLATMSTSTPTVAVGGAVSVNATTNSATISTSTPGVNYAFKVNAATNAATISTSTPTVTLPGAFPVVQTSTNGTYANRIDTTFNVPTGIANNDIVLASLFIFPPGTMPTITPPTGWTEISGSPINVTDGSGKDGRFQVWWKRAASETVGGTYTFSHPTAATQGGMLSIRGAAATGSPIDVSSANSANNGSTTSVSGITPTSDNTMLVWTGFDWTGSAALTPPTGFTEQWDSIIYGATKTPVNAASTGTVSMTNGNPPTGSPWGMFLLGIAPATTSSGAVTVNASGSSMTASTGGAVGSIPVIVNVTTNFCTMSTSTSAVAFPKAVDAATNLLTMSTTTPIVSLPIVVNATTNFATALTQDVSTKQGATATIASVPQMSIGTTTPDVLAGGAISVGQTGNFGTAQTGGVTVTITQSISTTIAAVPSMTISTKDVTVSGKANVSPTSPQMLISTQTPTVNTTFALQVLLGGNFATAQSGTVTVPIEAVGGFDLNPALSYSVHASLQNPTTTTTATINTGTLPFAYPNPFQFQDWSSNDVVAWVFGQETTVYTGGTRADTGLVTIMVTSPQMTMSLGATFVTGVAQPRPPEKEGRMLALTNMMGS